MFHTDKVMNKTDYFSLNKVSLLTCSFRTTKEAAAVRKKKPKKKM